MPAPVGRTPPIVLGTFDDFGPTGVQLTVEDGVLDGFLTEQFGALETIGPEGSAATIAAVEPLGVFSVDMSHEAGEIEQITVETFPLRVVPGLGFQPPAAAEAAAGPDFEFRPAQFAILGKLNHRVIVIPHQFEGAQTAAVESCVEVEKGFIMRGLEEILIGAYRSDFPRRLLGIGACGYFGFVRGIPPVFGNGVSQNFLTPGKPKKTRADRSVDDWARQSLALAGFDIETAARYNIPVVYLLFNNSGWISPTIQKEVQPNMASWAMLKDIRYDLIFEQMGCHTELVTEPEQIRPALEKAFNSGKTSVINVIPDDRIMPPELLNRMKARVQSRWY